MGTYVDPKALFDLSRYYYPSPKNAQHQTTKARKVLDISDIEKKAKKNVLKRKEELENDKKKRENERKAFQELRRVEREKRIQNNSNSSSTSTSVYHLNFIDVEAILETPISPIIQHFERGEESKEGSYSYIKTSNSKYTIIEKDNIAYDFKSDETFNPLTYLQEQLKTTNLNQIAQELKNTTGIECQRVDFQSVTSAIEEALSLKETINDRTFEDALKVLFNVQFVKFEKDALTIADKKISFEDINIAHRDIVNILISKRKVESIDKKRKHSINRKKM